MHRRGKGTIVAAGPPTEEVVTDTKMLTKADLVEYMKKGCKPKENWRIGTEHEKFGFKFEDKRRLNYEEIHQLLEALADRFGWERVFENNKLIALKQSGQSITLEPGGQFELSGAPLSTLHQTCGEVNSHLYQVKTVCEEMGAGFLGLGFDPKWSIEDIPIMPKGRYKLMKEYMPRVGSHGRDMMFRTCTVQVNLDFDTERDMINKMRVGLALQPIATALFANSPFTEGKPNGYLSFRSQIWKDVDPHRTGMLPFVFDDDFGFEKYVDYALNVAMYFVYRKKGYVDALGLDFKDFMAGKLSALPGEYPTINDWENHLTTIFPEVRLKRYIEMRGADNGCVDLILGQSAMWVGLLYDEESLQGCLDLISDWTTGEMQMLRDKVPVTGLRTPFRDGMVRHVAQDVLKLAREGLERRGFNEAEFLKGLEDIARKGVTSADVLLDKYHNEWDEDVDRVYDEFLY
ncbi:glutamate-cysteine ligase [Klebsormidium nitens]|uniref:Glutamate--cysteine ligase n=1 Tax=Klebsormidium nitens TaxID=105231 RepID=A0A1Y1ILG6_KLENI|nr:glutamate-cysteine ligase [Klebsormidium nitens]|eukprot:GAQ88958.1 glutamate-cysteine ligase [Klebsormidium nitens]